ncbi:MAG: hypothetical protein CM1200mP30_21880 [Pseudomonadota bacterium]|nr:MAG: hypothetical protein CM1200mP30_21880 [Pseudomonadota bacterium]
MFKRLFGDIQRTETASGFPPYNIRKDEEEKYTIEMAVAGFSQEKPGKLNSKKVY